MLQRTIDITREDLERLQRLVDGLEAGSRGDSSNIIALEEELDRARIVDARTVRPDVVTLNSHVRICDLDTERIMEYEIVYPATRPVSSAAPLSVLAPLGIALLGYRAGDIIEWQVPRGKRRLKVMEVLYQPEAASTPAA